MVPRYSERDPMMRMLFLSAIKLMIDMWKRPIICSRESYRQCWPQKLANQSFTTWYITIYCVQKNINGSLNLVLDLAKFLFIQHYVQYGVQIRNFKQAVPLRSGFIS